jgi:hypothetical protein
VRTRRERLQTRAQPGELAERGADLIDDVRAVRAQPTAAFARLLPPRGHARRRVDERGQLQLEDRVLRRADHAARDNAGELRLPRSEAELGAQQVHHADALRGLEHGACLGKVAGEGLLAHDVLSGGHRLEHDARVGERWGGHRDHIDARQRECLAQIDRRVRHVEPCRAIRGLGRVATDQRDDLDARGAKRAEMGDHPEAGTDDNCAQRALGHDRLTATGIR